MSISFPFHTPDAFAAAMRDSAFWPDYFGEPNRPDFAGPTEIDNGPVIIGNLELSTTEHFELGELRLGEDKIAWTGIMDWHPHVLRWNEVETLARAIALAGLAPHPGPVVALLSIYTPICAEDDAEAVMPTLETALRACAAGDAEVQMVIDRIDHRTHGFAWREASDGWVIEQGEDAQERSGVYLYSRRVSSNVAFPHTALAQLSAAAKSTSQVIDQRWRTAKVCGLVASFARGDADAAPVIGDTIHEAGCAHPHLLAALARRAPWAVALVADDPGVVARHHGPTPRIARPTLRVSVTLDETGKEASRRVDALLDAEFRVSGCTQDWWSLVLRGDPAVELRRLESRLRAIGAPGSTTLRWIDGSLRLDGRDKPS